MFSSEDRLQAAADDLIRRTAGGLPGECAGGPAERYSRAIPDGDRRTEMHGGFNAERARFATTADFTGLVKNAMNKVVANTWEELGRAGYDWWRYITRVEHCQTLNNITGILVGTVGSLPSVAEGGAYTELQVGDSPETASFTKYGGYIPLTLELIDRDETHKLRAYPRELAFGRHAQDLLIGGSDLYRQLRGGPHHGRYRRTLQRHRSQQRRWT